MSLFFRRLFRHGRWRAPTRGEQTMIEKSRRPWRRLENRMASRDAAAAFSARHSPGLPLGGFLRSDAV